MSETAHRNKESVRTEKGDTEPLGASWDGRGVNFAVYSGRADLVELCLYSGEEEYARIPIENRTGNVWHCYVPGIKPGQLYAIRTHGPWQPEKGLRYNPNKMLLDPYARAVSGDIILKDAHRDYSGKNSSGGLEADARDSAPHMPKCVVVDPTFDWGDDARPAVPWERTVIYELHVKGFTMLNRKVPEELRGTYAGLSCDPVIEYIKSLGVTSVELLPVHHSVTEGRLRDNGLTNYWGYNTIGFFAPDPRFSSSGALGQQVTEFKRMVKAFHHAGLEVLLDVVYNHTAEGGADGPALSFRGLDNQSYYRLGKRKPGEYENYAGTGNTLNAWNDCVINLVMDSLRYWAGEMRADGFRFDLATILGRGRVDYHRNHPLFELISADPILRDLKFIAEPWDLGHKGYQLGNFPDYFSEWNDRYRNTVRRFWRGDPGQAAQTAYRIAGSSDIFGLRPNGALASINYICSHDGFTLHDLVSYNRKHNLGNLENNRDGTDNNFSENNGAEGPTEDERIRQKRDRQKRNFIATVFLSKGVPMICAGDEAGRTQAGNNNAYCQDNGISWINWDEGDSGLIEFTKKMISFRAGDENIRSGRFYHGRRVNGDKYKDLSWYLPDGREFGDEDWQNPEVHSFCMVITHELSQDADRESILENSLIILMNASAEDCEFKIPEETVSGSWRVVIDTSDAGNSRGGDVCDSGGIYVMVGNSLALLEPADCKEKG